jgi:hypothetical protein
VPEIAGGAVLAGVEAGGGGGGAPPPTGAVRTETWTEPTEFLKKPEFPTPFDPARPTTPAT